MNIHFRRQEATRFPDSQIYYLHSYWFLCVIWKQNPMDYFGSRFIARIAGSIPAEGMNDCLLCLLPVV